MAEKHKFDFELAKQEDNEPLHAEGWLEHTSGVGSYAWFDFVLAAGTLNVRLRLGTKHLLELRRAVNDALDEVLW